MSSDDDDRLRFGDLTAGSDSSAPETPSEQAVEWIRLITIVIVGGYVVLYLLHALFGTPNPAGFF